MLDQRVRTSLQRAASTITETEMSEHREALERDLWTKYGARIVRQDDRSTPGFVRMWAQADARARGWA